MMVARVLPHDQWHRLDGTELHSVYPHLDPHVTKIVVVESEGVIVACWSLFPVHHVEGIWVHPSHRGKGRAFKLLLQQMGEVATMEGAERVMTGCLSDQVRELLEHFGADEVPGQQFMLRTSALRGE